MNDSLRRHEYNILSDEIKNIDSVIKRGEESAARLRNQKQSTFSRAQIEKITSQNLERKAKKEELETRQKNIKLGLLDQELIDRAKKNVLAAQNNDKLLKERKKVVADDKEAKSISSKAFYLAGKDADRSERYQTRSIKRTYGYFVKICNSIPDHIKKNLSEMPNNKGYIWKNVACYGELPAEQGPTVLFDRKRGGTMVIHEWTDDKHTIYHKKGKEPKTFVSVTQRKQPDLSDLPKKPEPKKPRNNNYSHRNRGNNYSHRNNNQGDRNRGNNYSHRNNNQGDRNRGNNQGDRNRGNNYSHRNNNQGDRNRGNNQGDRNRGNNQGDRNRNNNQGDRNRNNNQGDRNRGNNQGDRNRGNNQGDRNTRKARY